MKRERIMKLLAAKREDLVDGYPVKLALKAITIEGSVLSKRDYMNEMFEKYNIHITINAQPINESYFSEHGIIKAEIDTTGQIDVELAELYFSPTKSPLKQALRFQSIVVHELIHRDQMKSSLDPLGSMNSNEELTDAAYINDPYELEAMSAEVVHDLSARSVLGCEGLIEGSPRLNFITQHAGHLTPESILFFQNEMAENSARSTGVTT